MKLYFKYVENEGVEFPISLAVDSDTVIHFGPKHGSTSIWNLFDNHTGKKDDETVDDYPTKYSKQYWVWRPTDDALRSGHNEVLRKYVDKKLGFKGNKSQPNVDRWSHPDEYLAWCWGLLDYPGINDYHCAMHYREVMRTRFKEGDSIVRLRELSRLLEYWTDESRHDYKNDFYNHPIADKLSYETYQKYIIRKYPEWYANQKAVDIIAEKYYENQ